MMGIIYKATYRLDPNNVYIGKTQLSLEERRRQHEDRPRVRSLSVHNFDRVLRDTGFAQWKWEVLQDQLVDEQELAYAERTHIQRHKDDGHFLHNVVHNADHPHNAAPPESRDKGAALGAARAWDPSNATANVARYVTGKIKPVINLTTTRQYPTIVSAIHDESTGFQLLRSLCETGEPHPRTGHQYAFLDIDGSPILKDGHPKRYPIQRDVVLMDMATGDKSQCSLFEAARKLDCNLNELTRMKQLNLGGNRGNISCKGFLVFAIGADGKMIETQAHRGRLARLVRDNKSCHVWRWDTSLSRWAFEKKFSSVDGCAEFLSQVLGGKACKYKAKITRVLDGSRRSIHLYSVTATASSPTAAPPKLMGRPVIWLNPDAGSPRLYKDASTAADELKVDSKSVLACCNGRIDTTLSKRFAYAGKDDQPILTERHVAFQRQNVGAGRSVYWVQGDESFRSVTALHRRLSILSGQGSPLVMYVPKRDRLSKILAGVLSDEVGTGQYKFRITLRRIR